MYAVPRGEQLDATVSHTGRQQRRRINSVDANKRRTGDIKPTGAQFNFVIKHRRVGRRVWQREALVHFAHLLLVRGKDAHGDAGHGGVVWQVHRAVEIHVHAVALLVLVGARTQRLAEKPVRLVIRRTQHLLGLLVVVRLVCRIWLGSSLGQTSECPQRRGRGRPTAGAGARKLRTGGRFATTPFGDIFQPACPQQLRFGS